MPAPTLSIASRVSRPLNGSLAGPTQRLLRSMLRHMVPYPDEVVVTLESQGGSGDAFAVRIGPRNHADLATHWGSRLNALRTIVAPPYLRTGRRVRIDAAD